MYQLLILVKTYMDWNPKAHLTEWVFRCKIPYEMTIMQKVINALAEKEQQINDSPHQDILIKIRDNKILIMF